MKFNLLKPLILMIVSGFFIINAFAQDTPFGLSPPNKPDFKFKMSPSIIQYVHYYQGRGKESITSGIFRSGRHLKMMKRIFRENGVPEDLVRLSHLSNWFHSRGLWSIDAETARKYGLRRTRFIDETRGFEKATAAVAKYLKDLSEKFKGNWELTMAAYFEGEKEIDRLIRRVKINDFWAIYPSLPRESRNFVPNVLATIFIANNTEFYGFGNVEMDSPYAYDLVRVPPSTRLDLITRFSDSKLEDIKRLNPELLLTTTPPERYIVRVSSGKGLLLAERLKRSSYVNQK